MESCNARRNSPKRAVAYYRHSAQDRQENAVEIQQDQVRKFAEDNGIAIVEEFIEGGTANRATDKKRGV